MPETSSNTSRIAKNTLYKMKIYDFLNSELFQTVVLIITAGITLWIYFANQKQHRKNAVTILLLQIKEIENNIEFLLAEGIVNGFIQEKPLHYSKIIFSENMWSKYAYLIMSKIPQSSYEKINDFFKVATQIKEQQLYIKNKIQTAFDLKCFYYYAGIYSMVNSSTIDISNNDDIRQKISQLKSKYDMPDFSVQTFIQLEFALGLQENLKKYHKLTDGIAYSDLKKLVK